MILEDAEVAKVTGKVRPSAQKKALAKMGIPFRVRPDGSLLVIADDLRMTAAPAPARRPRKGATEPDWDACAA